MSIPFLSEDVRGNYRYLFEGLIEQSVAGIYLLQNDLLIYVNDAFATMCGTTRDKLIGKPLERIAPRQQRKALVAQYYRRLRGEDPESTFIVHVCPRGQEKTRSIEIHGRLITYKGLPAVIGVGIDITLRLERQKELEAARTQLRELLTHIQKIRDEERLEISMELHDAVGGMLSALRFDLIRMDKRIEQLKAQSSQPADKTDSADRADSTNTVLNSLKETSTQALKLLGETLHVVRQISENIHPSALPHLGLAEAIRNDLIKLEERYALKSRFTQWGQPADLPETMVRDLYRVFQESLNNIIKHAQANTVTITMGQDAEAFSLTIEDDGIGILNSDPQPGRYGLASMQERVRRYGGVLDIHSPIKKGVRLEVRIPLEKTLVDQPVASDQPI